MKLKFIAVATGVFLGLAGLPDSCYAFFAGTIAINETGETDLIVTGSPFEFRITGPADNWTIRVPPPGLFGFSDLDIFVGEPGDPLHVNHIVASGPVLTWQSDIENLSGRTFPTNVNIRAGGSGIGHQTFDLLLVDGTIPDSGTTVLLLGGALTGLVLLRRLLHV